MTTIFSLPLFAARPPHWHEPRRHDPRSRHHLLMLYALLLVACGTQLTPETASRPASQPVNQPAVTQPDVTQPAVTQPAVTQPDASQPDAVIGPATALTPAQLQRDFERYGNFATPQELEEWIQPPPMDLFVTDCEGASGTPNAFICVLDMR